MNNLKEIYKHYKDLPYSDMKTDPLIANGMSRHEIMKILAVLIMVENSLNLSTKKGDE